MKLSTRLARLQPSATVEAAERVRTLARAGVDVVNLTAGQPDLDTPAHIGEAAHRAIVDGHTRYTPSRGTLELRAAAATWLAQAHGVPVATEQVVVTSGAKQALYELVEVLLDEGDEVIIPLPGWPSYADLVGWAGGRAIGVATDAPGFVPDVDLVERAMTDRTRALVISSPANPTGVVYPEAVVRRLVELCARRGVLVISDDIYRLLVYEGAAPSVPRLARDAGAECLIIDGVSKAYRMTGWRIGFAAGPRALVDAMALVQSQSTTCPSSVSQAAALAALQGPQDCVAELRDELGRRRARVIDGLRALPSVALGAAPGGAFYAFPDLRGWIGARAARGVLADDRALIDYLLDEARVALTPGTPFGAPGFARLSYTVSLPRLDAAFERLAAALARLERE